MEPQTIWHLYKTNSEKFPYRLTITKNGSVLLSLLTQDKWPGTKGNIFCLRAQESEDSSQEKLIEEVPVSSYQQYGKRLAITLDRSQKKRCDFLFLSREYKRKSGSYEQIFWRTQHGLKQRRPKVKLSTYRSDRLTIAVDSSERYAWSFGNANVLRENLPAGDYALKDDYGIIAVVERKTFDNFVHEFSHMSAFHQTLGDLENYPNAALVIEAAYADFLKPQRMKYYPPIFAAKAIGEIQAFHPRLPVIFADNRKLAMEWTYRYFYAIQSERQDKLPDRVAESVVSYGHKPLGNQGQSYAIRRKILEEFPTQFPIGLVKDNFPLAGSNLIRRILNELREQNKLTCIGRGRAARWQKTNT